MTDPTSRANNPQMGDDFAAVYEATAHRITGPVSNIALDLVGTRILDIAAGAGALSGPAAERGATVLATDIAPGMVRRLAERLRPFRRCEAREMDGEALAVPDASFDAAFSIFGVMLFSDWRRGLREQVRVLRSGGKACVATWGEPPGGGPFIAMGAALRSVFPDIAGRNRSHAADLEELQHQEKLRLSVVELDVTDDLSVHQAVERVVRDAGKIDVLVNNAGISCWGLTETFTIEQARQLFETNFFGVLRVNRAVLPHMRQRRSGLLIHISSVAGRLVAPSTRIYCATKFALEAMAETLRYELSQLGIDSVTIEPGPYATAIFGNAVHAADQARAADYGALAEIPRKLRDAVAGIAANPQDVADRVVQLIEMPGGMRPARTLAGMEQFQPVNDVALQWQTAAMESFGFSELMTLRRPECEASPT
jgi:NAD(P)-dependent dehydrogenase (short-subunit alcohol dehydrogenase family)